MDEPLVIGGHNWRVTKAELPLALRDLDATDPSWKLFSAHVDCFRYILLDNRNVKSSEAWWVGRIGVGVYEGCI